VPGRVLIVSFAFARRSYLPQYQWNVAAAQDDSAYGTEWWRRRAWAKAWLGEMEKFFWWEAVDRWHYGPIAK